MKLVGIVGGAGAIGVGVLFVMLQAEKGNHAETRSALAGLQTAQARDAAARAVAVAEALEDEQAATAAFVDREQALRLAVEQLRTTSRDRNAAADRTIGRLKLENEELRTWAATRVPDAWVAWLRGELADPSAGP